MAELQAQLRLIVQKVASHRPQNPRQNHRFILSNTIVERQKVRYLSAERLEMCALIMSSTIFIPNFFLQCTWPLHPRLLLQCLFVISGRSVTFCSNFLVSVNFTVSESSWSLDTKYKKLIISSRSIMILIMVLFIHEVECTWIEMNMAWNEYGVKWLWGEMKVEIKRVTHMFIFEGCVLRSVLTMRNNSSAHFFSIFYCWPVIHQSTEVTVSCFQKASNFQVPILVIIFEFRINLFLEIGVILIDDFRLWTRRFFWKL